MKTQKNPEQVPSLRERVQEWDGLAVNVFGGVGGPVGVGRPASEVKAEREKLRAKRRATA